MLTYLILTIIVMSCFIAYLGDYLGRRLGKRRLTLFGMRPKHTAILITVLTGMTIASVTLGAAMVVSRDVRRALLQYHQIQDDLQQAQQDRNDAHQQASLAHAEADQDQKALRDVQQQEIDASRQEKEAARKLDVSQRELQEDSKALAEVRSRKAQLEGEISSLRNVNGGLVQDRQQKLIQIADLSRSETEYVQKVSGLRGEVAAAEQARDDAQSRVEILAARSTELQDRNRSLQGDNGRLLASYDDLVTRTNSLRAKYAQLQTRNDTLVAKNGILEQTNNNLQAANASLALQNSQASERLRKTTESLQTAGVYLAVATEAFKNIHGKWLDSIHNKVIFEPDQLVAQGVVDCGRPASEIRQAVDEIVTKAQGTAREAGAVDSDADGMVLRLLDNDVDLTHDEVLRKFTDGLSKQHGEVVVRIQALGRFAAGDEVLAGINATPNRRIYTRGQMIAIAQLDGGEPEKAIRNEVAAFLSTKVRPTALDAGLLPDSNNQISTDILDKILDLSHEVHEKGHSVQVTAIAANDTWCYEPLDLTFKVE